MRLLPDSRRFMGSLGLLLLLNLVIKPVWVLGIDRQVQNQTGYEAYGHYFALFSLSLVFQFLLDLGITPYFNRSVSAAQQDGPALFSQAIGVKLLLGVFYSIVVLAVAWFTHAFSGTLIFLLILLQVISSFHMLLRSYLSASQQFTADAWVSVTDKLFVIIVAGGIMMFPGISGGITINQFVVIQAAGLLVAMALAVGFIYRHNIAISLRPLQTFRLDILRQSLPFALNIFFMTVIMRADGFLLERMAPGKAYDAGTYATAFRLNDAVNMAGYIMAGFLLPYIARNWPRKEAIDDVLALGRQFLMIPAVLLAATAPYLSPYINTVLYHGHEPMTEAVINILFLCLPAYVIIQTHGTALTATGKIRPFMITSGVFAALLFTADLIVIPVHGARGAAWVAVCIQNAFALTIYFLGKRYCDIRIRPIEILLYYLLGQAAALITKHLIL